MQQKQEQSLKDIQSKLNAMNRVKEFCEETNGFYPNSDLLNQEGETSLDPALFRETDPEGMIEEKREGMRVGTRKDNQDLLLQEAETETTEREGLTAAPQELNRDECHQTQ